jgi:hypothetical protein
MAMLAGMYEQYPHLHAKNSSEKVGRIRAMGKLSTTFLG